MTADLPPDLEPYKRTAALTESTVPAGLLADHSTKEGVWGLIHVEEGKLRYLVTAHHRASIDEVITPVTAPGLIEPTILHRVEPLGTVKFHVEFLRDPQHGAKKTALADRGEQL